MYKHFTNNAKKVINDSRKRHGNKSLNEIKSHELMKSIIERKGCYGQAIIESLQPDFKAVILQKIKTGGKLSISSLIAKAARLAYFSNSILIGTEHLTHAFIETEVLNQSDKNSKIKNTQFIIKNNRGKITEGKISNEIDRLLSTIFTDKEEDQNTLETFCQNLNISALNNPPLIGKEKELSRITHILGRKNKNNPILIGDPGVGKTAIVEGLAARINSFNVPLNLANKIILSLDMGQVVAGTTFRGEFEARLKNIIKEAEKNKNIILFIDEIHTLIGAGSHSGGLDAANILKPALSRGKIKVIGATTLDEYQKSIERDAALDRRFQPIIIQEPSTEETKEILNGIKEYYEKYHQVKFTKEAIESAAKLAKKYIPHRFLPDSAIDLLDETAAKQKSSLPNKKIISKVNQISRKLAEITENKKKFIANENYEKALSAKRKENTLNKQLQKLFQQIHFDGKKKIQKVTEKDILETLSSLTNIPTSILDKHNSNLNNTINSVLTTHLVGQNKVKEEIKQTILRRLSGFSSDKKPLGSFLFIGPTGVGKTMTAKLLAQAISPKETPSLIQINMSEFSEKHTISRLLGAPAGYIGHENAGELSEKIKRNPFSVVLFDEIEKADPNILNILLQILDEGEIVDAKNKKINFKNSIIILTSNIGTNELNKLNNIGFNTKKENTNQKKRDTKKKIKKQLEKQLPIELLARLDKIIIFDNLTTKDIEKIIKKELNTLKKKLEKRGITLEIKPEAIKFLAQKSTEDKQGARLVKRNIQKIVEPLIIEQITGKEQKPKLTLLLNQKKNELRLQ